MNKFEFKMEHHYLFSDGVVRSPLSLQTDVHTGGSGARFAIKPTVFYNKGLFFNTHGFADNTNVKTPIIVLCVEEFHTWPFHVPSGVVAPECRFLFEGKEYVFFYDSSTTFFGERHLRKVLYQTETPRNGCPETKVIEFAQNFLLGKSGEKQKLVKDYEALMEKAREIQKQIGEL